MQNQKGVDDALRVKRRRLTQNATAGIDKLPDDLLITILSYISFKEVVRTSVLSRRWRYLWLWLYKGTLEFDDSMIPNNISRTKFNALVNHVLEWYRGLEVYSILIHLKISFQNSDIDKCVYFVGNKKVKRFELNLPNCYYGFPNITKLLRVNSGYGSLRSLRLINVCIGDDEVKYFIASCPYLEDFCIRKSPALENLQVVDLFLPNLKVMEITKCKNIQSMEISSKSLVSFMFECSEINLLPLKKTPNLSELTLGGIPCESFVYQPNKHSHYSVHLVKLVLNFPLDDRETNIIVPPDLYQLYALKRLELNVESESRFRSLLFFTSLIKASPCLSEFKIKMDYKDTSPGLQLLIPEVSLEDAGLFNHENLKVVEMAGYIGYPRENEFILHLFKIAGTSLEVVSIDTQSEFWCAYHRHLSHLFPTFKEMKIQTYKDMKREKVIKCANKLKSSCPSQTKFLVT